MLTTIDWTAELTVDIIAANKVAAKQDSNQSGSCAINQLVAVEFSRLGFIA